MKRLFHEIILVINYNIEPALMGKLIDIFKRYNIIKNKLPLIKINNTENLYIDGSTNK